MRTNLHTCSTGFGQLYPHQQSPFNKLTLSVITVLKSLTVNKEMPQKKSVRKSKTKPRKSRTSKRRKLRGGDMLSCRHLWSKKNEHQQELTTAERIKYSLCKLLLARNDFKHFNKKVKWKDEIDEGGVGGVHIYAPAKTIRTGVKRTSILKKSGTPRF